MKVKSDLPIRMGPLKRSKPILMRKCREKKGGDLDRRQKKGEEGLSERGAGPLFVGHHVKMTLSLETLDLDAPEEAVLTLLANGAF